MHCRYTFSGYHWQIISKDAKDLGNQVGGVAPAEFAGLLTKVSEKAAK